ncbi:MAG: ribosome maturation factor RimP [Propionibacteriaceae bacterium]|nr:ribosome maturation factor RimP [Propionibacteriaceae bacterium]
MDSGLIETWISPVVAANGLEIDRIEIRPAGRRKLVQIFLDGDGPDGRGPSLDEIASATVQLSRLLDELVASNQPYTLEVSSRGVSRPLTQAKHFRRNIGRLVRLQLADGEVTGRIAAVDEDRVVVAVDGQERALALADIAKAVVQVEMAKLED